MVGQLQIATRCMFAVVLTAATCEAEDPPAAAKRRSPTRISAAITESEVQDRLNLSAEQRKKIAELRQEREAKLAEIRAQPKKDWAVINEQYQDITGQFEKKVRDELSPEQQTQWSKLKQLDFASFSGPAWRVLDEEMQDELKLTAARRRRLTNCRRSFAANVSASWMPRARQNQLRASLGGKALSWSRCKKRARRSKLAATHCFKRS